MESWHNVFIYIRHLLLIAQQSEIVINKELGSEVDFMGNVYILNSI